MTRKFLYRTGRSDSFCVFARMFLVGILLPLLSPCVQADQYDVLRNNWVTILTGMTNLTPGATNNYNTNDPYIAANISSNVVHAALYQGYMTNNTNASYLFSNIPITNGSNQDSAFMVSCYSQLQEMATAYVLQGSSLQGNQTLLTNIIHGLDWMNANWYNSNTPHDLTKAFPSAWGWHDLEIVVPQALEATVALIYTNLTSNQIAAYMAAISQQEQYNTNTPASTPHFTGANCANKANVITLQGVLSKNSVQITQGGASYGQFVFPYVTNGDGFYTDGSFVFHSQSNSAGVNPPYYGGHAYNSGYGMTLLSVTPPTMQLLSGSSWDMTNPASSTYASAWTNLIPWVYNSFWPDVYNGGALLITDGRQRVYANPAFAHGEVVMEAFLRISTFVDATNAAKMQSIVKFWAQTNTVEPFLKNCSLSVLPAAEILMTNTNIAPAQALVGNFLFPCMDCAVQFTTNWCLAIAGYSTRMFDYESINGDNLWGWHQCDGLTTLDNADQSQYNGGYWWTVDPYRLPGTTVDPWQALTNAQGQSVNSTENWVGGVSWNGCGAFGMRLNDQAAFSNPLTAQKSWFLFTNEVICLGAGITDTNNHEIETIVENRLLSTNGTDAFQLNGTNFSSILNTSNSVAAVNWAHLTGRTNGSDVSWYFPGAPTIQVVRESRAGSQQNVMSTGSSTAMTNNYLKFWFSHGSTPSNATYQYVILPGFSADAAASYASNPPISILENSTNAQCIQQTQLGITAANFWKGGSYSVGGITCSGPASVLVQSNGAYLDLCVSDPTQTNVRTVSVSYAVPSGYQYLGGSSGITNIVTGTTNVGFTATVANAKGQTFHARFYTTVQAAAVYANTNQIYDGMGEAATVTVLPTAAQSLCSVLYSSSTYGPSTIPPVNTGLYVLSTVSADSNYIVSGTGTLTISQAVPAIAIFNTNQLYSGSPEPVSVTTLPAGLPVSVTYSNSAYGPSTTPPTAVGTYSVTATIAGTANYSSAVTNAVFLISSDLPAIQGNTNPVALLGQPFLYQIQAANSPTGFAASNLPAGLMLNTNTGLISGMIAAAGTNTFTVYAANGYGTNSAAIRLTTTNITSAFPVAGIYSWSCPTNVASLQVQCWGGGGAGGSALKTGSGNTQYAAGGAGGAYAMVSNYPVTPGTSYTISVGTGGVNNSTNAGTAVSGGDSWIGTSTNEPTNGCIAKGGAGGGSAVGTSQTVENGGTGTTNGNIGSTLYAGGSGKLGSHANAYSGGGGAGAGTNASGASATNATGAVALGGGGGGGNGLTGSGSGGNGTAPGGGGAGAVAGTASINYAGGQGGSGQVILTAAQLSGSVTLSNLSQTYSALAKPVAVATLPDGLPVSVTYGNTSYGPSTNPPTNAGSYAVSVIITNSTYAGSASGTLTILPASPVITFSGPATYPYNGNPRSLSATVSPSLVPVSVTYGGSPTAPVAVGSYTVLASNAADAVNSNWIASSASTLLTIYDPTDNWRQAYYGSPGNIGFAASDALCGNGHDNNTAYVFGLNPTSLVSAPLLTLSNGSNGVLTMSFTAQAAGTGPGYSGLTRYYNLEAATNIGSGATWSAVTGYSNILGSNQTVTYSTNTSGGPKWFYRLKAWLQ
jgi:hyaluronate lyase